MEGIVPTLGQLIRVGIFVILIGVALGFCLAWVLT